MSEKDKSQQSAAGPWYPGRACLDPGLDFDGSLRMAWFHRAPWPWSWYSPSPVIVPCSWGPSPQLAPSALEVYTWRVCLDLSHFSPSEISITVKDKLLQIEGRHEEKPDPHGMTAKSFTRKYRLPPEVDITKITSSLSVDGVLTVEVPVPETSVPAAIIIPIKVEMKAPAEAEPKSELDKSLTPEVQDIPSGEEQATFGDTTNIGLHPDEAHQESPEETSEDPPPPVSQDQEAPENNGDPNRDVQSGAGGEGEEEVKGEEMLDQEESKCLRKDISQETQ